jgi:2-polyprenyl-3-methyl-5-hydroxy-6-metoxy-1,4-benzoquinol methylase
MKRFHRKNNLYPAVDSKHYSKKYFLSWGNYQDFINNNQAVINKEYARKIEIAQIKPGMRVLDLGCGRGELLVLLARLGTIVEGVDYAEAAIKLSQKVVMNQPKKIRERISLKQADLKKISSSKNCYDRIFLMEVIEHLRPWEIDLLLPKIKKALKSSGFLVIYTYPNRLAHYGFFVYKLCHYLRYRRPPKEKIKNDYYDPIIHINEQTIIALRKTLKKNQFNYRVLLEKGWFFEMLEQGAKKSWIRKRLINILRLWPFRLFFFIDIYALAWKDHKIR